MKHAQLIDSIADKFSHTPQIKQHIVAALHEFSDSQRADREPVAVEPTDAMLEAAGKAYMETSYRLIYAAVKAAMLSAAGEK